MGLNPSYVVILLVAVAANSWGLDIQAQSILEGHVPAQNQNPDLWKLLTDEVQDLRLDLTRSFIAQHSRQKREILKYSYEASLATNERFESSKSQSISYPCRFKNLTLVLQEDGIYSLSNDLETPTLSKVTAWTLENGDKVLKTFEWNGVLFILTANGRKTKLYTLAYYGSSYKLRMKQEMRSEAHAMAATFFVHAFDLYLILAMDNKAHSLTISPIYRWSRTYMDQIHEIQTRGAIDVVAFGVSSYTYVAVAQAEDAAGNKEVGTLVLRIYGKGEVEKVQLLWSIHAVSVSYVRFLEEHFLVIGQKEESSICYWFGGYHFVYWQALPGLFGNSVFLDSFVMPDHEPLLLGSTESTLSIYTRRKIGTAKEISSLNLTSVLYYTRSSSERIVDARFIDRVSGPEHTLCVALSLQSSQSRRSLQIFPLTLKKVPVAEAHVDSEDKLSSCMNSLKKALDDDESSLGLIESHIPSIVTKSGDWRLRGKIISKTSATVTPALLLDDVSLDPVLRSDTDRYGMSPSLILSNARSQMEYYKEFLENNLQNLLLKSKPGIISAHLEFANELHIRNLQSDTTVKLETLNEISWEDLEIAVLRRNVPNIQTVSGNWEIQTLKSNEIETGSLIGNAFIADFLLTTPQDDSKARKVVGSLIFEKDVEVQDLAIGPYVTLNGIQFGEIALRSGGDSEIRGYKTGERVKGAAEVEVNLINGVKLRSWYEDALKIDGVAEESCSGYKTFEGDLNIKELIVDKLNGRNWDDFAKSVLLDGIDQEIDGNLVCAKLKVNDIYVKRINNVEVDDWMTTSTAQDIRSDIRILSHAQFRKDLNTDSINDIKLSDAIRRTETNVYISSPIEFSDLTLGNLTFSPYAKLNSLDISDAAKLRKKHIYSCVSANELTIDGNVEVGELESGSFNGIRFDSIRDAYWKSDSNNRISADFQFGSAKISVEDTFSTATLNSLRLENDVVRLSDSGPISGRLQFSSDVVVKGPLVMAEGALINDYDISEVATDIVRVSDSERRIGGKKEFVDFIDAKGGLEVGEINGIYLKNDLVFLEGYGSQDLGNKRFEEVIVHEMTAEVDVQVAGLVNGEDLKSIKENTIYADSYDEKITIESDVIFENAISATDLLVLNDINEIKVKEILVNVIGLEDEDELVRPLIISGGTVTFLSSAEVNHINGIVPSEYLPRIVSRKEDAVFEGRHECGTLIVDGPLNCHYLNNINLTHLEASAFSKTKHQLISAAFSFQELQCQGNLVTSQFSGIPISNLLRADQDGRVSGDVIFKAESTIVEGEILLRGLLNNYKIEEVSAYLKGLEGNRKFNKVTVEGNLSWEISEHSYRRLAHLLSNAVTTNTAQTISGRVTFSRDLNVKTLFTEKWIKGVDLAFILKDSLQEYHEGAVFSGLITFEDEILVGLGLSARSRNPVIVKGHLNTDKVNSIVLKELYQQVVTKNSPRRIYGTKTFTRGISAHKLNVYGEIDGVNPKDLITIDDERQIDTVTMPGASISNDLHFKKLNGIDFGQYFPDRITLEKDHEIEADWTFRQNVIVKYCEFYSINDLRLSNIFRRNSPHPQRFVGEKCFEKLIIEENLENVVINEFSLDRIAQEALHLDRDEIIERHVTFLDTVHLAGPLELEGGVNEYSINSVAEAFTSNLEDLVGNMLVSEETKERTTALILELERAQQSQGFWLDYVEDREWLAGVLDGPTDRVESFTHPDENGKVSIAFHGESLDTGKALPAGCTCTFIDFFHFDTSLKSLGKAHCLRVFDVLVFGSDVSYTVYSHVLSYNKTCSRRERGETFVSISQNENERYRIKENGMLKPDWSVGRMEDSGYISDVKSFAVGKKSYLVIAQSYDPYLETHRAQVVVFETTYDRLEKVQTIKSFGARRMALDLVNGKWILVIGNAGDPNEEGENCPVYSEILQWSPVTEEFLLLRQVATTGLVEVSLLAIDLNGYFSEAYVSFAQNEDATFGKLSIFKYRESSTAENFDFFQEIEANGPVGGVKSISVGGVSYVMLAIPSRGLQFYQHIHLEGFKSKFDLGGIKGASDVGFVVRNRDVFFPVSSIDKKVRGVLTQGIFQGRLSDNVNINKIRKTESA